MIKSEFVPVPKRDSKFTNLTEDDIEFFQQVLPMPGQVVTDEEKL
jgi:hypothetical protein